jgi:hypothetical protein
MRPASTSKQTQIAANEEGSVSFSDEEADEAKNGDSWEKV